MKLRFLAVLSCVAALASGCSPGSGPEDAKQELLAADKAFCEKSQKDGINAAFLAYITKEGKLLNNMGQGPDAVRDTYMQLPPTASVTWETSFVDVSVSGDLGYTWGRYTLLIPSAKKNAAPYLSRGTYVTIWKRQPGGKWKVVLDGGNPDGQK